MFKVGDSVMFNGVEAKIIGYLWGINKKMMIKIKFGSQQRLVPLDKATNILKPIHK